MPLVNLISIQRASKRATEKRAQLLFFCWIVEVVLFLFGSGFLMWRTGVFQAQISELGAREQQLAPFQKQISQAEQQIATIQPKLTTLLNAQADTERWQRILGHISISMPPRTWITSVRSEMPKDSKDLSIVTVGGFAADQELVGDVMLRLNTCTDLNKIELKYTQQKQLITASGIEFELGTSLKIPEATIPEPQGGANNVRS
ncbi:MAG: hypothetical protein WCO51_00350 [bacterium]|jgi:Tfp pilus assembly protein PilN